MHENLMVGLKLEPQQWRVREGESERKREREREREKERERYTERARECGHHVLKAM